MLKFKDSRKSQNSIHSHAHHRKPNFDEGKASTGNGELINKLKL